jgi:hypothetical protein
MSCFNITTALLQCAQIICLLTFENCKAILKLPKNIIRNRQIKSGYHFLVAMLGRFVYILFLDEPPRIQIHFHIKRQ